MTNHLKRVLFVLIFSIGISFSGITAANAGEICADGTWSKSSGRGTCSWHGGIAGGSGSKSNPYKAPAPAYKAPAPAYKAPAPAYKAPSNGSLGITGFCSAMDRNKGRCR